MSEVIIKIEEVDGDSGGFKVTTSKQEIQLLIDNHCSCCEQWGYFWCNDDPIDFIGASLLSVSIVDTALNTLIMDEVEELAWQDAGETMFVNLTTDRGVLQFVAYNCHNGYYGHKATVISKQLNHSEYL